MTEYANPIVNAAVKLGMNKKEALLMADNTAEIDFEAIRKLNKSVEYFQSGQFQLSCFSQSPISRNMFKYEVKDR